MSIKAMRKDQVVRKKKDGYLVMYNKKPTGVWAIEAIVSFYSRRYAPSRLHNSVITYLVAFLAKEFGLITRLTPGAWKLSPKTGISVD